MPGSYKGCCERVRFEGVESVCNNTARSVTPACCVEWCETLEANEVKFAGGEWKEDGESVPWSQMSGGSVGTSHDQTCSLVSRSHQRCGRMSVPNAAIAQMVANSMKLAMRKNPPFISCIERGPMTSPPWANCTTSISLPTAATTP